MEDKNLTRLSVAESQALWRAPLLPPATLATTINKHVTTTGKKAGQVAYKQYIRIAPGYRTGYLPVNRE